MWDSSLFHMNSYEVRMHWIAITGTVIASNFNCVLVNIYNPCQVESRAEVWREVHHFWELIQLPCLLIGDYNETLSSDERGSQLLITNGSQDFQVFFAGYAGYRDPLAKRVVHLV